ncbi:MAG: serine hydrolase domain-containing protein [Litorimonas sp.]
MTKRLFGLIACLAIVGCNPETVTEPTPSDLDRPGHIVGLVTQDGLQVIDAAGAANIEQARPITPDAVFHIASLSKQITAAALAHAVLDDHVSLDDPVSLHLPEAAKYGDELTVAHLVYMTSGLTDYTSVRRQDGRPWATFHYFTTDDAIEASLSVDALKFRPGTAWDYSNVNYMLITRIVEAAYDRPFADVVEARIFRPLGMKVSLIHDDVTRIVPNRADAYIERNAGVLDALRGGAAIQARDEGGWVLIRRNAPHYGGSGVLTSLSDWSLWLEEMLSHETFGEEFWTLMRRTQTFEHDKANDAFGLVHGRLGEFDTLWYEGGDIDASSYMVALPSEGAALACFANDPSESCRERVMNAFADRFGTP